MPASARRWLLRTTAVVLPLLVLPSAIGATYYQIRNHNGSGTWDTLADWNTAMDGSGTSPSSISSSDHFIANRTAWQLRTPGTTSTFGGGSLTLESNHYLRIGGTTTVSTVPNMITRGTPSLRAGNSQGNFAVSNLHIESGSLEVRALTSATAPTLNVTFGRLTGTGDLFTTGPAGGTNRLTFTDASSFQGSLSINTGKVEFLNAVSSGGSLIVTTPANVTLNHAATFMGLTVNGSVKNVGTYSASSLGFAGSGSVTVRTPKTWYLTTSQSSGQDWTPTYVTQWKANSNGSGATATSINAIDTYNHTVGSNVLRTPAASSTFYGGTLNLGGSAQLVLAGGSSAISTVPHLASTGGTINAGTATRNLAVDTFTRTSGTTTLTTGSGGVLNLFAGELKGSGNITIGGSGQFRPFIDEGNGYTGTFTVNSGATLSVQTKFGTAGKLVVNSGGLVVLNDYAYVTALTVGGTAKPVGTYTASNLGSGFSGSGRVVVYTRDLAGPPQMFGVNLAGAEFKDDPGFWQTNPLVWDYYKNKGLTLIRLPFKWRRIQSTLNGSVNFTKLDECVALARARGMKVILDMHDYSKYVGGDEEPYIGEPGLPFSAYADVWSKIAAHYKNDPAIYGYDIMNEPKGGIVLWAEAAQQAVDAIRKQDQTAYVLVEGMSASSSSKWVAESGSLDIKDPVGRLIYSAHSYWDSKQSTLPNGQQNWSSDGIYISNEPRAADRGVVMAQPFVEWLQTRPYAHGNFGEYGIPDNYNSADWNIVLGNFLAYLRANNISATYWAGGSHWGNYQLSCHPDNISSGPDKAQMAVLEQYNNGAWQGADIGNTTPAGSATVSGANVTVLGAGGDIFGTSDNFHYAYQTLNGNGSITVRAVSVQNTNSWAKAGPMIRESLDPGARNIMVRRAPGSNGTSAQWRTATNGSSSSTSGGNSSMPWMRLTRSGNTFTAARSTDGVTWSTITTQSISMPTQVYIGLAVTSHSNGTLCTAVFDNLTIN